jgi:glycosyltransferase involved in cell wall biosynthesis
MENLGLQEERTIVLPNPVKIPIELPKRANSQNINFLFLGRICDRKGAFDLIEAFAVIPPEQKQICKLIMAGDGDAEKARSLIEKNNLSQYITILDWVNEQQRDELLANANVFILPSYNEGLPMALLEAMSWGLPVITTPVGGIPELVINNENGLLVQAGAILDLSTAMQSLIKNEYMRLSLGSAARRSVLSFDVEFYCINLIQIYRSISTNV